MKKFRLLPLLALVIAIGASAFTQAPDKRANPMLTVWQYEPQNANGPSDPLNYVKLELAEEEFNCEGEEIVCQIQAEENAGKPVIAPGDDPSLDTDDYHTTFRNE